MFECKVLADHDKRQATSDSRAISMATRARRSATDVDRRELVVSASCQASSDRMRRRRNIIPSPGPSSDRRPMCAKPLTARIVVITRPLSSYSQSPAMRSVVSASRSARARRSRVGDLVVARAVEAGAHYRRSHTCSAAISYAVYASASSPPSSSSRGTPGTSRMLPAKACRAN